MLSRRVFLSTLLSGAATGALAGAPALSPRPQPRPGAVSRPEAPIATDLIAQAKLTGTTSFVVADARTGKVLEARDGQAELPPASVTKAVTALYALDRLGSDFRFVTRLLATGTVRNGKLNGDLVLVGGGDPTLDTDALGDMAEQLRAAGVREIVGKFLVYGGALPRIDAIDKDQPVQVGYNPAVSGLNLNFNRVHFEWKRQSGSKYQLTMDARAKRFNPHVRIAEARVVERATPIYTYADKSGKDVWTVARPALGQGGSRWLPVRKPELYAAEVFSAVARAQGVNVPPGRVAKRLPKGTTLVGRRSAPLRDILRDMLKFSTNLTAEVVGLAATGNSATSLKASARKMTAWARGALGLKSAKFVDHSGLGGESRLTTSEMVTALAKVRRRTELPAILKDIPMRNSKGEILRNHPVKIRAKTGTLNFTSALAGYMTTSDGRELVFAIISSDIPRRKAIKRADGERPQGSAGWRTRARRLQLQLIDRWGATYAS